MNIKKFAVLFVFVLFVTIFLPTQVSLAQDKSEIIPPVQEVLIDITNSQKISSLSDLTCEKITENQYEQLGESVMQARIGDITLHEQMDERMGGEGSESLRAMHIRIGEAYLGCATGGFGMMGGIADNTYGGGMMGETYNTYSNGMMGGRVLPGDGRYQTSYNSQYPHWSMVDGGWGYGHSSLWLPITILLLAIGGGTLFVVTKRHPRTPNKEAVEILNERYARGEVDAKEYNERKSNLMSR